MAFQVQDPWAVPAGPDGRRDPAPDVVLFLGAWLLGASGPVWSSASGAPHHVRDALGLALIALAWALLLRVPITRSWVGVPLLVAGAAAAVLVGSTDEGHAPVVVALLGVLAADAALFRDSRLPGWPRRAASVATLAMPLVIFAELTWVRRLEGIPSVALLLAALVVVEVYRWWPQLVAPIDRALDGAISWLAQAVATIVVFLAAVPTLYLPGLVLNLARRLRRHPGPRWRSVAESLEDQRRDARYPFATTPPATRRHRYRVALVLVLLLVPVTIVARDRFATTTTAVGTGRPIEFHSFAYPDAPWVSELYAARWPEQYHPSRSWKSADVTTRYLNVHDGVRRSWTPAHPQFEVWFLGGSALYGLGQRDDHSIPSEVARLSAGSGLPIKAINLGVPGYDQWQEQAVMAERLSRGEHPDLVVFYDGANDLTAMEKRATEGIEPLAEPPNRFQQDIEDVTGYPHETRGAPASDAQLQAAFLKVYGAGLDLATRTAAAYGVPTAFYWQPEYYSTKPSKADGPLIALYPELAPANVSGERALRAAIRSKLPPTVVDLGASLDDVPRPTFFDPVHTNEQGARGVAEAMWPSLRQKLLAIAGTAEHPPS